MSSRLTREPRRKDQTVSLACTTETMEIPALNRPFALGMLYDAVTDKIIPGITLWNQASLEKNVHEQKKNSAKCIVTAEDTLHKKAELLKVNGELKLSVLCLPVGGGGAVDFLRDHSESGLSSRVVMLYENRTNFRQLVMEHLAEQNHEYSTNLESHNATHVVTGIEYGLDAFLVFETSSLTAKDKSKAAKELEMSVKISFGKIAGNLEDEAKSEMDSFDKNIRCIMYADCTLPSTPQTFQEAVDVFSSLPNKFADAKEIPKWVWLHPLSQLTSTPAKALHSLNCILVEKCVDILQDMCSIREKVRDLQSEYDACVKVLPYLEEDQSAFLDSLAFYESSFRQKLQQILPKIRGGKCGEMPLTEALEVHHKSPFNRKNINKWLSRRQSEYSYLNDFIMSDQNMVIYHKRMELSRAIKGKSKALLYLQLNTSVLKDPYICFLEKYNAQPAEPWDAKKLKGWSESKPDLEQFNKDTESFTILVKQNRNFVDAAQYAVYLLASGECDEEPISQLKLLHRRTDTEFVLPSAPTSFLQCGVLGECLQFSWSAPITGAENIQKFECIYRKEGTNSDWVPVSAASRNMKVSLPSNLHKGASYQLEVYGISLAGRTEAADRITVTIPGEKLNARFAGTLAKKAKMLKKEPITIYLPVIKSVKKDQKAMIEQQSIGEDSGQYTAKRVILIMGASGAGKSTLINGLMNYLFQVEFADSCRFKVIVEEGEDDSKRQTKSMTSWITTYTVYPPETSPFKECITVIDTPGFGDTGGLARDQEITDQLATFLLHPEVSGVNHIDAVGIVVQGSTVRLPPAQLYIYNKVLSFFGKDIRENLFWLISFAPEKDVPAVNAIKSEPWPSLDCTVFENSVWFQDNKCPGGDDLDRALLERKWKIGVKSMGDFLEKVRKAKPASLELSRAVIRERVNLELIIKGLIPQINEGLAQVNEKRNLKRQFVENQKAIESNKNFMIEITETVTEQIDIVGYLYAVVCPACETNCHYPCVTYFNSHTWMCEAMDSKYCCTVCPNNCSYQDHQVSSKLFAKKEVKRTTTAADVMESYHVAVNNSNSVSSLLEGVTKAITELRAQLLLKISETHKCLQQLEATALKPNHMSALEYIDLLIIQQKDNPTGGWKERVIHLQEAKKEAETLMKCVNRDFDPIKDADPPRWDDALKKYKLVISVSNKWTDVKSSVRSHMPELPSLPEWMKPSQSPEST